MTDKAKDSTKYACGIGNPLGTIICVSSSDLLFVPNGTAKQ
jgi:hypothetical protein